MESQIPKRKFVFDKKNEVRNEIPDIQIKVEDVDPSPRNALVSNNGNLPLYQAMRFRANFLDEKRKNNFALQRGLRRSLSHNDLQNIAPRPLKRNAIPINNMIPAKFPRTNAATSQIAKNTTSSTTSSSNFKKPTPVAPIPPSGVVKKTVSKTESAVAGKVAVKRIPSYDYKARYYDLLEKHKVAKEKLTECFAQADNYETMEQTLETTDKKCAELQSTNATLKLELNLEKVRTSDMSATIRSLKTVAATFETQVKLLTEEVEKLSSENEKIRPELNHLKTVHAKVVAEKTQLQNDLTTSRDLLFESNLTRKQLHNEVLDLKGNIRVFCRVRPPIDSEINRTICGWQYMDETSVEISLTEGGRKQQKHEFSFDQVFHPQSSQIDIFGLVSPLIQSAFDGYNVCIFAYGQTGSGKTFTMEGSRSDIGIIPRTGDLLFHTIENYRHQGWTYSITASCLEIYNEVLYDLLSNEQKDLEIRMVNPKTPQEIIVSNLREFPVMSASDLREILEVAKTYRATAATAGNERSSRSHAVTQIKLTGYHKGKGEQCIGKINLIDLAGSESPKASNRMDETKNINRSLSELTNVIMALVNQNVHVPYRNSKLTHLLMPNLGGNSKTLMFINAAPFEDCFKESVKSLRFAASVNACKMGKVKKNMQLVGGGNAH